MAITTEQRLRDLLKQAAPRMHPYPADMVWRTSPTPWWADGHGSGTDHGE